jgi:hypothetical protein
MRDDMKVRILIAGALLAAGLAGGDASAKVVVLKDTGLGNTDILNTTGELTGGDSTVKASTTVKKVQGVVTQAGVSFEDIAYFEVKPRQELTSYSITNLATAPYYVKGKLQSPGIGELWGGQTEIYMIGKNGNIALAQTIVDILKPVKGVVTPQTDYSDTFKLGVGQYFVKVDSSGLDAVAGQGNAKYSLTLQGVAVPEPSTWAMMMMGVGALGMVLRGQRRADLALAA